jgi:hypothetical protein
MIVVSTSAQTQIRSGNSRESVSLQAMSGASLNVGLGCLSNGLTGNCTLSGVLPFLSSGASFGGDTGSHYYLTAVPATPITALNSAPGTTVFPMSINGATTDFVFSETNADTLQGRVTWSDVAKGSTNPHFNGTLNITLASGDPAFMSILPGRSAVRFDLILGSLSCDPSPRSPACTLESLSADVNAKGFDPVSGGQQTITPRPTSMLLFGSCLLTCGALIRRRRSSSLASA